jgi:hypothetical protein
LQKEENKDYFRGPDHCARVRQWRQAHPGYWKRVKNSGDALPRQNSVVNSYSTEIIINY